MVYYTSSSLSSGSTDWPIGGSLEWRKTAMGLGGPKGRFGEGGWCLGLGESWASMGGVGWVGVVGWVVGVVGEERGGVDRSRVG